MRVKEVVDFMNDFANEIGLKVGGGICVKITPLKALDMSRFPDEVDASCLKEDWQKGGVYIFHNEKEVLYIGKANSIEGRVYQHLGSGFNWARNGKACSFPNFKLTIWDGRTDIVRLREVCQSGRFQVTGVVVEPIEAAKLIESAAIFWCFAKGERTPLNIEF